MDIYYLSYFRPGENEFQAALAPQLCLGGTFYKDPFALYELPHNNRVMLKYSVLPEMKATLSKLINATKNIAGEGAFYATSTVQPNDIITINCYEGYYYLDSVHDELVFKPCNKLLRDNFIAETVSKMLSKESIEEDAFSKQGICALF